MNKKKKFEPDTPVLAGVINVGAPRTFPQYQLTVKSGELISYKKYPQLVTELLKQKRFKPIYK